MTEAKVTKERDCNLFPCNRLPHLLKIEYQDTGEGRVIVRHAREEDINYAQINLDGGATSRHVTCTIVSDNDRQVARERSQKLKEEGSTLKERLEALKKHLTSAKLTIKAREYELSKTVYEHVRDVIGDKAIDRGEQRRKEELEYTIKCFKADRAKERNPTSDVRKWKSTDDIKDYLQPLKKKVGDKAWPTNRAEMELLYLQISGRTRLQLALEESVMNEFVAWKEKSEKRKTKRKKGNDKKK